MSPSPSVVIHITASGKNFSRVNYSRRIYAILRRYTPDVAEGEMNECYADLTGLRTFFKMTYKEMAENILKDLTREIGVSFMMRASTVKAYEEVKNKNKIKRSVSTYKELNKLFAGASFIMPENKKSVNVKRMKMVIPFLGRVS